MKATANSVQEMLELKRRLLAQVFKISVLFFQRSPQTYAHNFTAFIFDPENEVFKSALKVEKSKIKSLNRVAVALLTNVYEDALTPDLDAVFDFLDHSNSTNYDAMETVSCEKDQRNLRMFGLGMRLPSFPSERNRLPGGQKNQDCSVITKFPFEVSEAAAG